MMNFFRFYLLIYCFTNLSWAQMRPFQTARLHSSAGAGLATILLPESSILNPSTLVYFNESHISYHQIKPKFSNENDNRVTDDTVPSRSTRHAGLFVFDNSGAVKGGATHLQQKENNVYRERSIFTLSQSWSANTSIGVNYRYTHDILDKHVSPRHTNQHQAVFGVTHIYSSDLTLAAVVEDPFLSIKEENRAFVGAQYAVTSNLMIVGDYGGNYAQTFSKNTIWRAAAQFNIFSDFFVRLGKFVDKAQDLEGLGWGISWVTPKFVLEYGSKRSKSTSKKVGYLYPDEKITDSALSLAIRF